MTSNALQKGLNASQQTIWHSVRQTATSIDIFFILKISMLGLTACCQSIHYTQEHVSNGRQMGT